jgi:hypothetical protein
LFWGLVGDECEDESAEDNDAEAGREHDVARNKGCFEFGFGFLVHGLKSYKVGGIDAITISVVFKNLGVFLPRLGLCTELVRVVAVKQCFLEAFYRFESVAGS